MKKLLLFTLAFSIQFAFAQDYDWVNVITAGSEYEDRVIDAKVDHNDKLIQAGNFLGTSLNIGNYTLQNLSSMPGEEGSVYVAKYNNDGSVDWVHALSITDTYAPVDLEITESNNYLVYSKFFNDTLYYDQNILYLDSTYRPKGILLNLNEDGTQNWKKTYVPYSNLALNKSGKQMTEFSLNQVTSASNGDILATGSFMGTYMDIVDDTLLGNDFDLYKSFFARYNSAGDLLWSFTDSVYLSAPAYGAATEGQFMVSDDAGNTYIGAKLQGDTQDSSVISLFGQDTLYGRGYEDIIFAKFDEQGNYVWSQLYGNYGTETIKDLAVDNSNNIYMLAYYESNYIEIEGQTISKPYIDSASSEAGLLLKFDQDRNLIWHRELGLASPSKTASLDIDDNNNVIVKTQFLSDTLFLGDTTMIAHNNSVYDADLLVAEFSSEGIVNWAYNVGGYQSDGVAQHDFENNHITFGASIDKPLIFGNDTINKGGGIGFYYAVLNSDGSLKAVDYDTSNTAQYPGEFTLENIEATGKDEIFVSGEYLYQENIDGFSFNDYGAFDIFTGKIQDNLSIEGTVSNMIEEPVQSGIVYLYKVSEPGPYTLVDSMYLDASGYYKFGTPLEPADYMVMAVPDRSEYPNLVTTYPGDALSWENAPVLTVDNESFNSADIYLQEEPARNGNASVSGNVEIENAVKGVPVKGVSIILVSKNDNKFPVDSVAAFAQTDFYGNYVLPEIEPGNYSIAVDIPGVHMDSAYVMDVVIGQDSYEDYNYIVENNFIYVNKGYITGGVADEQETPITDGYVKLYALEDIGELPALDSVSLDQDGNFIFNSVNAGTFLIKAFPGASYPNYLPTYYSSAFSWKEAIPIEISHSDTGYAFVYLLRKEEPMGDATIEGKVEKVETKITNSTTSITGQPVKGVSVILVGKEDEKRIVYKANENVVSNTETDQEGYYQFADIEQGLYSIVLDIPGLEQDSVYDVNVEEGQDTYDNYNYVVDEDTIYINKESNPSNILFDEELGVTVYPNPAKSNVFVKVESEKIESVELYNVAGQKVYSQKVNRSSLLRINVKKLSKGLYFLKLRGLNNEEVVRKLLIQ